MFELLTLLALGAGGLYLLTRSAGAATSPSADPPAGLDWSGESSTTKVVWDTKKTLQGWAIPDCAEMQANCDTTSQIDLVRLAYAGGGLHNAYAFFWVKASSSSVTGLPYEWLATGQIIGVQRDAAGALHIGVKVVGDVKPEGPAEGTVLDLRPAQIAGVETQGMANGWAPFKYEAGTEPTVPAVGKEAAFFLKFTGAGDDYVARATGTVLSVSGKNFRVRFDRDFVVMSGDLSLWAKHGGIPTPFKGAEFNLVPYNLL